MFKQDDLGTTKGEQKSAIHRLIKRGVITLAGNRKLKIYGQLGCGSGKRMKPENRVFFEDEAETRENGYRPCGNCMQKNDITSGSQHQTNKSR